VNGDQLKREIGYRRGIITAEKLIKDGHFVERYFTTIPGLTPADSR
jgi:hypothetical protein